MDKIGKKKTDFDEIGLFKEITGRLAEDEESNEGGIALASRVQPVLRDSVWARVQVGGNVEGCSNVSPYSLYNVGCGKQASGAGGMGGRQLPLASKGEGQHYP